MKISCCLKFFRHYYLLRFSSLLVIRFFRFVTSFIFIFFILLPLLGFLFMLETLLIFYWMNFGTLPLPLFFLIAFSLIRFGICSKITRITIDISFGNQTTVISPCCRNWDSQGWQMICQCLKTSYNQFHGSFCSFVY